MGENRAMLPRPVVPSPEFFRNPENTIATDDGAALLSYDPETRAGLIFFVPLQRWAVFVPCTFDDFAAILARCGIRAPGGEDARRWLAACSREPHARGH